MKKALSLILALLLVVSCFAGCGGQTDTQAPTGGNTTGGSTAAPGGSTTPAGSEDGVVNIVVMQRGIVGNTAEADVIAAMNAYSAEKIGVTITFISPEAADFPETLSRMIAAKDELDATFVASYTGFADLVAKGGLMDITDYIKSGEYAELYNSMPEFMWEASSVGGRNYCVPNYKETPFAQTLVTPKALADTIKEKYGVDFNSIEIHSFRDLAALEPYLEACKKEGIKYPALTNEVDMWLGALLKADTEYEAVGTNSYTPYVMNKKTHEVSNVFTNPDFADWFETMARWNELGYWSEDNIPLDWNPRDHWALGDWGVYPQNEVPNNAAQQTISMGVEVYSKRITQSAVSSSGALGSTWAITSYSTKADAAMKWINLIETDHVFADMFIYGIEGVNYTRDSEDVVTKIADSGWSAGRWKITNINTASITSADDPNLKAQYAEFNNAGVLAELYSFTPDYTNIESENAAMSAVLTEVYHLYTLGFMTPDDKADTAAKLAAAGDATIIAELQSQINAYFGK